MKNIKKHHLTFKENGELQLDCYVDTVFARLRKQEPDQDPVCVKSRAEYVTMLNECTVYWVFKLLVVIK